MNGGDAGSVVGSSTNEPAHYPYPCLSCGYDLTGLDGELRCPECGVRNIPEGLRRDAWDFVDVRRWFYSPFINPFARRPPGWWWALDRDGDVRRCWAIAARNTFIAGCLILAAGLFADAVRVEITQVFYITTPTRGIASGSHLYDHAILGLFAVPAPTFELQPYVPMVGGRLWYFDPPPTWLPAPRQTHGVVWEPSFRTMPVLTAVVLWALCVWFIPATVGLWTQIRKELPPFARARRTIVAAGNLESHRLLYLGMAIAAAFAVEVVLRLSLFVSHRVEYETMVQWGWSVPVLYGLASWIGPLRSDFTRQLVRSRVHAVRIWFMYVVVLPAGVTFTWWLALRFVILRPL